MELRKTEERINELSSIYESIRQSTALLLSEQAAMIPPLTSLPALSPTQNSLPNDKAATHPTVDSMTASSEADPTANPHESVSASSTASDRDDHAISETSISIQKVPISNMKNLMEYLQALEYALARELPSRMNRFRKRLTELDPVTEKPRYGPKSKVRVERLISIYDFLCLQLLVALPSMPVATSEDNSENVNSKDDKPPTNKPDLEPSACSLMFQRLVHEYQIQQEEMQRHERLQGEAKVQAEREQKRLQLEEAARQQALSEKMALERASQEAAQAEQLRQQAEEARRKRQAQEEAQQLAEQNYLNSIVKGPDGVQHYVQILKDDTKKDLEAQRKAIKSLCTIFEQIQRHPEETSFRKIRKNHPAFHQDIGRHKGGVELLIAAGFRPTMLPATSTSDGTTTPSEDIVSTDTSTGNEEILTIACLVSKEPNIDHEMDEWTAWYDLNKNTLEILQKEVQKIK